MFGWEFFGCGVVFWRVFLLIGFAVVVVFVVVLVCFFV